MHAAIATLVFFAGIVGLFWFNRDSGTRTSKAIWIALIWLLIAGSRNVGQWISSLQGVPISDSAADALWYSEGSPVDRFVYSGLLLIGLIVLVRRWQKVLGTLRANWPLVAFSLYCAVSISWSDYPDIAFKRWIKSLGDFVMVLIILTENDPYAAVKRILAWAGFLLIPASILLIRFYPDLGRGYHPWVWTPYYTGVTTNKNELGRICLILGLGFVWRFQSAWRIEKRVAKRNQLFVYAACLVMMFWLFWMAQSMTSWSCFLLASALMVCANFRSVARRPWIVHAMVFTILAVSMTTLFLDLGSGVLESMGRDPTLTGRTDIWKLVLGMVGNPLLGTGFESFWLGKRLDKMWSIYWWKPRESHNGYIELYLSLGWLGLAMFANVLVTGYRTVMKSFRRNAEEGRIRLAFFVVAVAYNFAESAFGTLSPIWICFLLATLNVPGGWIRTGHRSVQLARTLVPSRDVQAMSQV